MTIDSLIAQGDQHCAAADYSAAARCYASACAVDPEGGAAFGRLRRLIRRKFLSPEDQQFVESACLQLQHPNQPCARGLHVLADLWASQKRVQDSIRVQEYLTEQENDVDPLQAIVRRAHRPCGPRGFILGAMKAGTTSLNSYLRQHPQVLPTARKEIRFFSSDDLYDLGIDWYQSFFPPTPLTGQYLSVDATPAYLRSALAPGRLQQHYPHAKLMVLLRNPVDRAVSQYHYEVWRGKETRPIEEALEADLQRVEQMSDLDRELSCKAGYVASGMYAYQLAWWMRTFPREQFFIESTDRLHEQPQSLVNDVFRFLGLNPRNIDVKARKNVGAYSPLEGVWRERLADFYRPHSRLLQDQLQLELPWIERTCGVFA